MYKVFAKIENSRKLEIILQKTCFPRRVRSVFRITVCPGSSDPPEKKTMNLYQKMRFTPFINYYDTLG